MGLSALLAIATYLLRFMPARRAAPARA
jgi:hypothetical protein